MSRAARGSSLLGFLGSAFVHCGFAAALLWLGDRAGTDRPSELPVPVSLAMFEPNPEPKPGPGLEPEPAPEPKPKPEPEPKPETRPELKPGPEPKPEPEPKRQPEPKPEPKPKPKPKPKPEIKLEPKPRPEPEPTQRPESESTLKQARAAPIPKKSAVGGSSAKPAPETSRKRAGSKALEARYLKDLRRAIARQRRYPDRARRRGETGTAVVAFVIDRSGRIGGVRIARSSGSSTLDKAALETLRRLGRFKRIPDALGRSRWTMQVPIGFYLQ